LAGINVEFHSSPLNLLFNNSGRVADHRCTRWYILGDHSTRPYNSARTDTNARQQGGAPANTRASLYRSPDRPKASIAALWVLVIGKRDVGADKNIIANAQSVPQLHAALDGDPVTENHIVLNQTVRANIAVLSDPGTSQDDHKLPDASSCADSGGLNVCKSMYKRLAHQLLFFKMSV
jgi:hypothetical protein